MDVEPEHVVDAVGNSGFNVAPIGSGYKFVKWDRGVAATLERNDSCWATKAPFAQTKFRAVPDTSTRLADLQPGTVDFARALTSDQAAQLRVCQRQGAPGPYRVAFLHSDQ
jgi:peptide/nickel transport system substrate-binding protein